MDTTKDFSSKGSLSDSVADRVQGGIREANQSANSAASTLSAKVDSVRKSAGPALDRTADQAEGLLNRGVNAVTDTTQKVRDSVAGAQESLVTYTKENPVKALLLAAATGAVLLSLIRALTPSRDR